LKEIHKKVRDKLYRDAICRGGVISGQKNIGLMRAIKKSLDPEGIFNPGKIF